MKQLNIDIISLKGLFWKFVDCVDLVGININSMVGQNISGVIVTSTTRVLTTAQLSSINNGIYVNGIRSEDFDTGDQAYGSIIYDVNNKLFWYSSSGTIGISSLNFQIWSGINIYTSDGRLNSNRTINQAGNTLNINGGALELNSSSVKYGSFGQGFLKLDGSSYMKSENIFDTEIYDLQNSYYVTVYTDAENLETRINTYYYLSSKCNVSICRCVAGDHIRITASDSTEITFSDKGYILNWSPTTSNPVISIKNCTIELVCVRETYYVITTSRQTNDTLFNINGEKQSAISELNDIPGIEVSGASNGQLLSYNGSNWVNTNNIISFNSRTGAVMPQSGDYSIAQLAGVLLTSPSSGQILSYNGTNWVNSSSGAGVTSFNSRTGAVIPQANDYTIAQIQNSSILASTSNVTITSPSSGQYLSYNGSNWINSNIYTHITGVTSLNSGSITTTPKNNYFILGGNITIGPGGDYGDLTIIFFGGPATLSFGINTLYMYGTSFNGGTITATAGSISILHLGSVQVSILSMYGNFTSTTIPIFGINLSNPTSGQLLRYNGSRWVNFNNINSFNSRTGAVVPEANDYNITQIQNNSVLANSNNVNVSGATTGQILQYNGTQWVNVNFTSATGTSWGIPFAELSFNGTYALSMPVINTYYLVAPATVLLNNNGSFTTVAWTSGSAGRLTWNLPFSNRVFNVDVSLSFLNNTSNPSITVALFLNGTIITNSRFTQRLQSGSSDQQVVSYCKAVTLNQLDILDVRLAANAASTTTTVSAYTMTVTAANAYPANT